MTIFTRQDINQLLHFAALSAAQKLGLAEIDWDRTDKLSAAIRTQSPTLGAALDAFIKAYIEWFEFGERIKMERGAGTMSHMALMLFSKDTMLNVHYV